jgi:hypothetical protein
MYSLKYLRKSVFQGFPDGLSSYLTKDLFHSRYNEISSLTCTGPFTHPSAIRLCSSPLIQKLYHLAKQYSNLSPQAFIVVPDTRSLGSTTVFGLLIGFLNRLYFHNPCFTTSLLFTFVELIEPRFGGMRRGA